MATSMDIHFDPPSGSYSAPVKISLKGPENAIHILGISSNNADSSQQQQVHQLLLPHNCWHISIEHVEKIDDVFAGAELRADKVQTPSSRSVFVYDGPFRITRAGKMRVCAWPHSGSCSRCCF
jgi:hypothetical protein